MIRNQGIVLDQLKLIAYMLSQKVIIIYIPFPLSARNLLKSMKHTIHVVIWVALKVVIG